jgi:hypothetical protein
VGQIPPKGKWNLIQVFDYDNPPVENVYCFLSAVHFIGNVSTK